MPDYPTHVAAVLSGGGGGAFTPASISGLQAWYDASVASSVISDGARQFISASTRYFSRTDDANFSTGDIDFFAAGWVYFDDVTVINESLFGKWNSPLSQREYLIFFESGSGNTLTFGVTHDGGTIVTVSSGVTPSINTWYFVLVWHDSVNDTINIKVNNGTTQTTAHTLGVFDGTATAAFGAHDIPTAPTYYLDGRLDSWVFAKNPVGGIAGLIDAINTSLYNGGAGKTYGDLTASEITNWGIVAFYNFSEVVGSNAIDSHAGLTFTASASAPTANIGIVSGIASDGDVVSQLSDLSGNAKHMLQATVGVKPIMKAAIQNGLNVVRFDGTNDFLQLASAIAAGYPITVVAVAKSSSLTANQAIFAVADTTALSDDFTVLAFAGADAGDFVIARSNSTAEGSALAATTLAYSSGVFAQLTAQWDSTTSRKITMDGGNDATNTTEITPAGYDITSLGILKYTSNVYPLNGDIGEIVIYNTILTATQISQLQTYFKNKWGTP